MLQGDGRPSLAILFRRLKSLSIYETYVMACAIDWRSTVLVVLVWKVGAVMASRS